MAAMIRDPKNKATKVFFKIFGKPQNMQYQGDATKEKIDERLAYEDTRLVR